MIMNKIGNAWNRFKCTLIGFDYELLKDCSVKSKKLVTKYFSAILIIIIIWFFIGHQLVIEYIEPDNQILGLLMGLIFVTIVIMVERQIILSSNLKWYQTLIRFMLGLIMAFIGATIIDAALFKNDIEIRKNLFNKEEVEKRIEFRSVELEKQISSLEVEKDEKSTELTNVEEKIARRGSKIQSFTYSYKTEIVRDGNGNPVLDSLGNPITKRLSDRTSTLTDNPDLLTVARLRNDISRINDLLETNSKRKSELRDVIIAEVNAEKGIIKDLIILVDLLIEERVGLIFYIFWFLFFLIIELLVLFSKISEKGSTYDYYEKVNFQEQMSALKLKRLLKNSTEV